ncbi:hypothetical protein MMC17_004542 [Xylographa soralifera]|nr:hypothetical protein [Xylographa soralifera]
MAKKRKNTSSTADLTGPYNKRPRALPSNLENGDSISSPYHIQSRVDPTYGQRGAFPGLDSLSGEDELFQGPANDGMEYLRMVRSEAKEVPNLLVAPSQNDKAADTEDGTLYEDYETGYYEDGAYAALPDLSSTPEISQYAHADEDVNPQEAYYASLNDRFSEIRMVLHSSRPTPNPSKPQNDYLSASAQAIFLQNATHREWRYQILKTTPSMRLLASMHQDGVIRGLSRLETLLPKKDLLTELHGIRIGAWCWGLLGRCREIGEMGSEEVGVLRTLGKTALRMGRKLKMQKRQGHAVDLAMKVDEGDDDEMEHEEGTPEAEPQKAVNSKEGPQEQDVEVGQIEEEMEEGEVDEDEDVAEPTDASGHNDNMDFSIGERNKHDPQGTERRPERDIYAEAASGTVIINSEQPRSLNYDGLAQYEQVKDPLTLAKESLLTRLCSPAPSASQQEVSLGPEDNNEKGADVEAKALATLDMIVTIVGEFYGQKDLLDAREVWGE